MADTDAFVEIDYAVDSYLSWKGIASTADYDRYKQILIEGFTDMNLYHTIYSKTIKTTVNEVNQIKLPSDFIDWIEVYVYREGYKFRMDFNENIVLPVDSDCSAVVVFDDQKDPVPERGYKYTKRRRNPKGEFTVDRERRVLSFYGSLSGTDIYVNYISTGVPKSGKVWIPREMATVLRTYLDWQLKEADDRFPLVLKQRAEQLHGRALKQYIDSKSDLDGKTLLNLFRNGLQQGIKR